MEVYILDNKNLNVLSVCRPCSYNLNLDEETNGKTELVLPSLNYAKKGYYLVLNGLYKQFIFVIDDVITAKEEKTVTVVLLDISNIFDRKVILRNKEAMQEDGIENYIADEMDTNFINSNDSILNLNYVDVYVHSTTKASVTINDEDNLYNFHTYLINCRQYKNIYTEFKFEGIANRRLRIDIENKLESALLIDTTLAEVTGYNKIYEVDPVTKVEAYVRENGSTYNLYLRTDRTTTTDKNDVNRLEGRIETISCDTLENAQEEALNVIRANTYKHLVEFNIAKSSKLIDVKELHIGRPIKIKTTDSIYDSYISAIVLSDENFVQYKTGNLRIDFTDKQRVQQRSGVAGTKLDVSGGNVTGVLKVQGKEVVTSNELESISNELESKLNSNKVIQENGTVSTSNVYSSKAIQNLMKASFCKMTTNFESKAITNNTKIEGFKNAMSYGDYIADVKKSRLVIKNTKLCQLAGLVCGIGNNRCCYGIFDADGNEVIIDVGRNVLYQFGGNGYFQAPLPTLTIELNPSKTYYIFLYAVAYNSNEFLLNAGFGADGTWISATKIM